MATCANGHPVADGGRFCPTCGLAVQATPAAGAPGATAAPMPAPTASAAAPAATMPPAQPAGGSNGSKRTIVIVAAAAVAVLLVVGLAALLLRGGSAEPLTAATARAALLSESDLPMPFVIETDAVDIDADVAYDPGSTPECTTVLGVSRLSDLDPSMPLGSPAFPVAARGISLFEGRDFTDTLESVVSSFDERILVFPTADAATRYLETIGQALEGCPVATRNSSADDFLYVAVENYRDVSIGDTEISWIGDSTSTIESEFLDTTIRSVNGVSVVQRGPNVLIVDWYLDEDDELTDEATFSAATDLAEQRFTETTG